MRSEQTIPPYIYNHFGLLQLPKSKLYRTLSSVFSSSAASASSSASVVVVVVAAAVAAVVAEVAAVCKLRMIGMHPTV